MFLDQLREKTKEESQVIQLRQRKEKALEESLNMCAQQEYNRIKEVILAAAQAGRFKTMESKRIIEGDYYIPSKIYLSSVNEKLNQELLAYGEPCVFPDNYFYPRAIVKKQPETEYYKKTTCLFFQKEYKRDMTVISFEFTDTTLLFLQKINALATQDGIELLTSTIRYGAVCDDDVSKSLLVFDNLFESSEKIRVPAAGLTYYKIFDLDVSGNLALGQNRPYASSIRIRYRVEY